SRPRAARRRADARPARARPPPASRAGRGGGGARGHPPPRGGRRDQRDPGDVMRGALATGALGLALVLLGVAVDAEPLLVPGVTLVAVATAAAGWVAAAARGARVERELSTHRVMEEQPLSVRITARAG